MSTTMKTPGVYIQELDAFGNAVVPVPTAVPAFIGYTAQTSFNGKSLLNKAVKVTSLAEFLMIFGPTAPQVQYKITSAILPERIDNLQKVVDATAKTLATANEAVTKATDPKATPPKTPTQAQTDAATAAKTANDNAIAALTAAQADPNIAALLAAQAALTKAQTAAAAATTARWRRTA